MLQKFIKTIELNKDVPKDLLINCFLINNHLAGIKIREMLDDIYEAYCVSRNRRFIHDKNKI